MPVMCNVELLRNLIGMAMVTGLLQEPLPFALGLTPFSIFWGGSTDDVRVHICLVVTSLIRARSTSRAFASSAAC